MPYTQTSTSLGALSSVTGGAWTAIPKGAGQVQSGGGAGPIITIAAATVTSGAVVAIEGRRRTSVAYTGGPTTPTKELHRVTIAANGTTVVPLKDLLENGQMPDEVRINVVSRTDGTYTGAILTPS